MAYVLSFAGPMLARTIVKNDIKGIKGDIKDAKESINIITTMPGEHG